VVSVRAFGELAFHVADPVALLAKLTGTGSQVDLDAQITEWVTEQAMAGIRAVLPGLVAEHGVLAMGDLQDATASAALAKANLTLAAYGVAITTFAQLNVNVPDADAHALKQFAATKAYTAMAGSFDSAVRGEAALEIADGIASGSVNGQGIVAGLLMGVPGVPAAAVPAATAAVVTEPVAQPVGPHAAPAETASLFCTACGAPLNTGAHFCARCGSAVGRA
jgi:membrane protease subunit (stomatin/prohibitin family)